MNMKTKIAALSTLLILQCGAAQAAAIDDELAAIATEKADNSRVEIFDPEQEATEKTEEELREEKRKDRKSVV